MTVVLISLEDPDDLPSTATRCGAAALIRKQDFGPAPLRAVWGAHEGND